MILGIKNRTENWKTARTFARMYPENLASLANYLLKSYCEFDDCNLPRLRPGQVQLELFWKGVRDHVHLPEGENGTRKGASELKEAIKEREQDHIKAFARLYDSLFPDLRYKVDGFPKGEKRTFNSLQADNYIVSTDNRRNMLFSNLRNTEIDIVIASPNHLFIGEAKGEMGLHSNSKYMLVHQLIRQYVMANILLKHLGSKKTVVPFMVSNDTAKEKRNLQARFMLCQEWLKKENILAWEDVGKLAN